MSTRDRREMAKRKLVIGLRYLDLAACVAEPLASDKQVWQLGNLEALHSD